MRIESKAPTRVDLAGGTLDIWPLYLFHPGDLALRRAPGYFSVDPAARPEISVFNRIVALRGTWAKIEKK